MEQQVFDKLREIIYRESGISLNNDKVSLLSNRLQKRLRYLGLSTPNEYLAFLSEDHSGEELVELLDAISTNVTYFYREDEHFKQRGEMLGNWNAAKKNKLRIWCAAASSGEEPYTLAITVKEHLDLKAVDFKMLATDICLKVLRKALDGVYSEEQFRHMPVPIRNKYFEAVNVGGKRMYQVEPGLGDYITYKRLNLSVFPYPLKGPFDFIFCRNVMIYFDVQLRQKIINEFQRLLSPGGYLFVSRSETLLGVNHNLKTVAVSVYQKTN